MLSSPILRIAFLCTALCTTLFVSTTVNAQSKQKLEQPRQGLSIQLPRTAQQAINHGVPITLSSQYGKQLRLLFDLWHTDRRSTDFVITRHALSNRYLVTTENDPDPHIFLSIPDAMDYIAYQATLLLEFHNSNDQQFQMRLFLNKYKLPSPMRLKAFFSDDLDLDSGWITWTSSN